MNKSLVSIVIPTKQSARFLADVLLSIKNQSYSSIEVLIIDGYSTDETVSIASDFGLIPVLFESGVPEGKFDAPHRRNHGARIARGEYVYYVDTDMVLQPTLIEECVSLCESGASAVIIEERSFGTGIWAMAKSLERSCYVGDNTIEAPRFFPKNVWNQLGGLDESLGGGGDDWDLHEKLKASNKIVMRTKSFVMHNEGNLKIKSLIKKRFMYGRDSIAYIKKRPRKAVLSYFPVRFAFIRNWKLLLQNPLLTLVMIIMRILEYSSGALGIIYAKTTSKK